MAAHLEETTVKTTCPYCGVGCGVLATRKKDGSVSISGDPDHPSNFGRLCSKGSALGETLSLDDRLLVPEVAGQPMGWDAALDLVAEKFSEAVKKHGPDSVAFYVSGQILTEDYYVANKLMKGYIGSANIDTNSRLCMASSVAGHRRAFGSDTVPGTYEDLETCDLLVLVGSNLAWCHPVLFQRVEAAKAANPEMRVVVIDPRETATCAIADLHLALKPDTDVALFNGLLAFLSENGALDTGYIERHTQGFYTALAIAGKCEINRIADETGLPPQDIALFYTMVARTEKTATVYSQGVNQSVVGTDKVNAIINTHLATGRIGKSGMGPFSVTGQPNAMGGREVGGLANMLASHMALENADHRKLVQDFWQSPVIADRQGLKAVDLFKAVKDGKIKALWVMATSPVDSLPDADEVAAALEECPFVVVSEVTRNADMVAYADVLLPAAAWGEKDGTVTNSERRISRQKRFLDFPGEAKPDWWQLTEVAKRMGFEKGFSYTKPSEILREHADLSAYQNDGSRDFDIGALKTLSDEAYEEMAPVQWPLPYDRSQAKDRFFENGGYYTPNKLAQFIAVEAQPVRQTERRFPLALNTGRIRDQWHTMTRTGKTGRLTSHIAEPFAEIHPDDAQANGIAAADIVEVRSSYGKVLVRAQITDRVQKGAVFVPMHWTDQSSSKGRVDAVIAPKTDPVAGQPGLKFTPVAIRKVEMAWYGFAVLSEKPKDIPADYWALAPVDGGWRLEMAATAKLDLKALSLQLLGKTGDQPEGLSVIGSQAQAQRFAYWKDRHLQAAFYFSSEPVEVSRQWACSLLKDQEYSGEQRAPVLAGRPAGDRPDPGALVCACFGVGRNEITASAEAGAQTVQAIGACLNAGTNCGSCRSEIQTIIDEALQETRSTPDLAKTG
ncbi:nitrate reductase [Labrenzia sp. PHM005]|uniref:nitrate reductase n=1 Tax=Labrenzia sp. PHM005 TaxID=2590016 RepID=UPI00114041CB|nr:nitrate reductase [Labrenzia sp. PHM005]QDG79312.1 nitrate reductase [Labrenzia sp. PHM005]